MKTTSVPVEITIENVFVKLISLFEWHFDDNLVIVKKIKGLANYC